MESKRDCYGQCYGVRNGEFCINPAILQTSDGNKSRLNYRARDKTDNLGVIPFKYLFFALNASIKGYAYMRKVVAIDGTHLRGRYGGCLVAASTQVANFQCFPLAFGIVNSENDEAWTWFINKLSDVVPDEPDLVFVSDRHASIYASIRKVLIIAKLK